MLRLINPANLATPEIKFLNEVLRTFAVPYGLLLVVLLFATLFCRSIANRFEQGESII
jgi:hypothetical protein